MSHSEPASAPKVEVMDGRLRDLKPEFGDRLGGLRAKLLAAASGGKAMVAGRYELGDVLGSGVSGVVYRAIDRELERPVALKIVNARSDVDIRRVMREAQALARVNHPNVVEVFEVGLTDDGRSAPYLVMELVAGRTVRDWMSEGARPWRAVLEVGRQLARGLWAAHRAGVLHRDFKPANALMGDDGRVRIVDFGLAGPAIDQRPTDDARRELQSSDSVALTPTGQTVGTPAYMAPEGFAGQCSAASDQYSLCVVLFEALVGQRPIDARTTVELQRRLFTEVLRVPHSARVPRWFGGVIERGLSREPEDRFESIGELIAELDRGRRPARNVVMSVAAVAMLGIGVGSLLPGSTESTEPCARGDAPWAAITGLDELDHIFRVPITQYAEDWQRQERELCAQRDGALDAAQRRCLDERVGDAQALVDLIPELDRQKHAEVARALESLRPPRACADAERVGPAPARAQLAALDRLQPKMSRLRALDEMSQIQAGLELARELIDDARAVGYAPAHWDAARYLARFAHLNHDYALSTEHYEEAYFVARDAGLMWRAGSVASNLVMVYGFYLAEPDVAAKWEEHARAAYEAGGYEPMEQTQFVQGLVRVAQQQNDYARAERLSAQMIEHLRAEDDAQTGMHASFLTHRGLALRGLDRLEDAIEAFEAAGAIYVQLQGPDSLPGASMRDNIGVCLRTLGRKDEALAAHVEALRQREGALGKDSVWLAYSHGNISLILMDLERPEEALDHAGQAVELFERHLGKDHQDVASAYGNRARVLSTMGPEMRERALADYEHALLVMTDKNAEKEQELRDEIVALRERGEGE